MRIADGRGSLRDPWHLIAGAISHHGDWCRFLMTPGRFVKVLELAAFLARLLAATADHSTHRWFQVTPLKKGGPL